MSIITVRCRLVAGIKQRIEKKSIGKFSKKDRVLLRKLLAGKSQDHQDGVKNKEKIFLAQSSELARKQLWHLFLTSSSLVDELLDRLSQHPNFRIWQQKGNLPDDELRACWLDLKNSPLYDEKLPGIFFSSVQSIVKRTYITWLAVNQNKQRRLNGLNRLISIVFSDESLLEMCQCKFEQLQAAAESILSQINRIVDGSDEKPRTIDLLFEKYVVTSETETLSRSAISYLIRHGCKIKEEIEPTSKFTKWLAIKLKQAKRLKIQLSGHFPRGRNVQGQNFLSCLESVNRDDFSNEQDYLRWSIPICRNPPSLPHPIEINSNMDLRCLMFYRKHHKYSRIKSREIIESVELIQRLFFEFKGLTQGHNYVFEVYCDRRQLSIFQQFFQDNQLWRDATNQQEQYSSSLFTLRSAHLLWERKEFQDRHRNETISTQTVDEPWNTHQLYLHCAIETKSLTAEGIKEIQLQKTQKMNSTITKQLKNIDPSIHQQQSYKKNQSSLALLERSLPRPSRPVYQGNSQIMVGLIFCPANLIHLVIVNVVTGESIAYRSTRQLLGDKYSLLSEYRLKQKNNAHSRRKLNRRGQFEQPTDSNQAEYINRLIAKAVIKVTTQFRAVSIVLPFLNQTIEKTQSKLEAIAEEKFPEDIGTQKKLTSKTSTVIHKQSRSVLSQYIKNNAAKLGIPIETHLVSFVGSPIQQARMIAITAYSTRNRQNK